MEPNTRLQYLLERLKAQSATTEELDELYRLVEQDLADVSINQAEAWLEEHDGQPLPAFDRQRWMEAADKILAADKLPPGTASRPAYRLHFLQKWGWAAAVVLLCGAAAYFLGRHRREQPAPVAAVKKTPDIPPGKNGAILTLANGSRIVLDSLGNGLVSTQQGTSIVLKNNGLQYTPGKTGAGETEYNTITTPKGRQFRVVLPDGTKVWLNAGSSLKFPVAFNGRERVAGLTGEAYFEVTKNAAQPFKLNIQQQVEIEVLGTSFNVKAYTNEQHTYTTLIDGAVRVSLAREGGHSVILKPGEQAQSGGSQTAVIRNANVEKAVAWKNGLFNFDGTGLKEMMQQLERWYNLEVVYEGNVPDVKFFGEMSRSLQLSDVLAGLERSNVHFRLEEGRRLVVMP